MASLTLPAFKDPVYRYHPQSSPTLTSFSPQMLLMMELEAGLDDGPRTATTPLGRIWHTVARAKNRIRKENTMFR